MCESSEVPNPLMVVTICLAARWDGRPFDAGRQRSTRCSRCEVAVLSPAELARTSWVMCPECWQTCKGWSDQATTTA